MNQHTPGPWTARLLDVQTYVVGGADGIGRPTICEIPRFQTQSSAQVRQVEADARLIAAAPELLEAAKELLETFFTATNDVANGLRIAVAKAEGRDPVSLQEEIDRS